MNNSQYKYKIIMVIVIFIITCLLSFSIGRYYIAPMEIIKVILNRILNKNIFNSTAEKEAVILILRFPRIMGAILVGSSLSLSGATYQGTFKNSLVAPDLLGVSSGASIGAAVAILLQFNPTLIQIFAFFGGLIAVSMTLAIPKFIKNQSMIILVLSGIIVSGLLTSIMGIIKYVADPETQLAPITYWQLGSLAGISHSDLKYSLVPIALASILIYKLRWQINILSLGDEDARSLGLAVKKMRVLFIILSTILTASSVSMTGTIGWIGLVVPHFARLIVGVDNRKLIPTAFFLGAIFLLIIDTLSRTITRSEIPLSILTGILGAPFYFYLLLKQRLRLR